MPPAMESDLSAVTLPRWPVSTWIQLAAYLVAIVLAYNALSERITRIEERQAAVQRQYETVRDDLKDIQADLKTLLRRP